MKKLFLFAWLLMLSIVATAQSIIVVDKKGNRTIYDVEEITSVDFQTKKPGFTVKKQDEAIKYTFNSVQKIQGNPNVLFPNPEAFNASSEGEAFAFQVKANTEYVVTSSDSWITIDTEAKDGQAYATVAMNPSVDERTGSVLLTTKGGTFSNTLYITQAGKEDSRYIDIDWEKNTLDSYDPETGVAVITFKDEVPIMGEYDVVMLPDEVGNLIIRVIEEVTEVAGKTVTLKTMEGDMGNLFRDQEFAFEFGGDGAASARGTSDSKPVFRPEKVEVFEDGKYVEVYNANAARARRTLDTGDLTISYDGSSKEIWSLSDRGSIDLKRCNLHVSMKGTIEYTFKKEPWYKVWKSSATKANVLLEGNWDSDIMYRVVTNTAAEINYANSTSYHDDDVLKANALQRRYTFKVGNIPVQVVVDGDVKCSYQANLMGVGNITSGLKVGKHFKYGIKVNTQTQPEFVSEDVIDRSRTSLSYPQVFIGNPDYLNSNCIGGLTVYPDITIGFYGIGSRTVFRPVEQLNLRAQSWEANHATNPGEKAERVRVSRLTDVHILMTDIPSSLLEVDYVYGKHISNLDEEGHAETLVVYPEFARITPDDTNLMEGDEQELEVTAFHHNYVTGEELPTEGAWVEFELVGSGNNKIWKKTDENGKVKLKFTKGSTLEEKVKYRLYTYRNEYREGVWTSKLLTYNIKCETPSQEVEKGAENVPVTFLLQKALAGTVTPWANKRVEFIATNGTVSPRYNTTDANGYVKAFFTPTNDAPEGEVTVIVTEEGVKKDWEGRATGKITIKGGSTINDESLKKAENLKDNTYVVNNKKTGETETRSYDSKWSEWSKGKDGISVMLEDADENGGTQGMVNAFLPLTIIDVVTVLTGETFENTPGIKLFFEKYQNGQVLAEFMKFSGEEANGNIKPDGNSKILLRKRLNPAPARNVTRGDGDDEEYTGEYELLFYLVFQNQTWNNETQQMELGDEYEVYGKGTMHKHIPTVNYFELSTETDWVKVGKTVKVKLNRYSEEAAEWNWKDVQLVGQSTNYADVDNEDQGFFEWNASKQTLKSVKSNDNKSVVLKFALKSNPEVRDYIEMRTGDGWPYKSFELSPAEQEVTPGSRCSFSVKSWKPASDEFDVTAIEIDPESDPNGDFMFYNNAYYAQFGGILDHYNTTNPTYGEHELRFRLKSNHKVTATMKITVKKE